jgi:tetratricopeptide (TPR) repeat protein
VKDQHEPDLEDIIQHMQNQPSPIPEEVVMLSSWMMEQNKAREALVWLESLDKTVRSSPQVLNALAACALITSEWAELEKVLLAEAWGPLPAEAVRYAFDAREVNEAGNESKAESLWNSAVRGAETSQPGLRMLVRLAGQWQWPRKQEQALWELVQNFPSDEAGWQKLSTLALSARDSEKIWRIYSAWALAASTNNQVRINRLVLGIFIRPAQPGLKASIEEVNRLTPSHPGAQLAQAMVYWRDHRWPEALALLDRIPLQPSAEPRLALARGLVLASLGRATEAEAMFAVIPSNVLLPEETALLAAARQRN